MSFAERVTPTTDVLTVIPARAGSKSIPRKNLAVIGGKPLVVHAIEQARAARHLSRVLVSTEDEHIAGVARQAGAEVPWLRPVALAADETSMLAVIQHVLEQLQARERWRPEAVLILQPTSPLRRPEDIDAAIALLRERNADSVVSVVEVPHQFRPGSLMELRGDRLVSPADGQPVLRRQDKPVVYARNGPAVLAVRRHVIEQGRLYGERCLPLVMPPERSVDIDGPFELMLAEFLFQRNATTSDGTHASRLQASDTTA